MEEDLVAALADPQRYASPARECDIVLKGGITSGVIYPLAVLLVCWHSSWSSLSKPAFMHRSTQALVGDSASEDGAGSTVSEHRSVGSLAYVVSVGEYVEASPRQQNVWRCRLAPELAATVQRNATAA